MDQSSPWRSPSSQGIIPKEETVFQWRGRSIGFAAQQAPWFLPALYEFHVSVDGQPVECRKVPSRSTYRFDFEHQERNVVALVESLSDSGRYIEYRVLIEGEVVHRASAKIGNWWVGILLTCLWLAIMVALLFPLTVPFWY